MIIDSTMNMIKYEFKSFLQKFNKYKCLLYTHKKKYRRTIPTTFFPEINKIIYI